MRGIANIQENTEKLSLEPDPGFFQTQPRGAIPATRRQDLGMGNADQEYCEEKRIVHCLLRQYMARMIRSPNFGQRILVPTERRVFHCSRCWFHSSVAVNLRSDGSEIRSCCASAAGRNKISS
jgi:hypothetical protein